MARAYFKVFNSYLESIEPLTERERGRLFTALLEYSITGKVPELKGNERFVFPTLKVHMDMDIDSYETKIDEKRRAGAKGGKRTQEKRREALSARLAAEGISPTDTADIETGADCVNDYDNEGVNRDDTDVVNEDVNSDITDGVNRDVTDGVNSDVNSDANSGVNRDVNSDVNDDVTNSSSSRTDTDGTVDGDRAVKCKSGRERSRFVPPTVEEVREYCRERGNRVDAQTFVDHYTANGWLRGRTPMVDWRASVRVWENKEQYGEKSGATPLESSFDTDDFFEAAVARAQREAAQSSCESP